MDAWDCLVALCFWAWHQLDRLYGLFSSFGVAGCMLTVAMAWRANRWGLQLTLHHPLRIDTPRWMRSTTAPRWVLGCLLQVGSTALVAIAMIALVRGMVA